MKQLDKLELVHTHNSEISKQIEQMQLPTRSMYDKDASALYGVHQTQTDMTTSED